MAARVLMPPSVDSGLVARVVAVDGLAVVEVWDRATSAWVPGDPDLLASVPKWPPAMAPLLERLGIPDAGWNWTPGERRVLAVVARTNGWEWTERHADRILREARAFDGDDLEQYD